MAIITISRQLGSLGEEIAKATADTLGYKYIGKLEISEVLSKLGFSLSDIEKYDEKKPSVWQTLSMQKELFAHFIRAAVYELAAQKNVVIIGRAGQVILRGIPGTLNVRIIAPLATRAHRLVEQGYEEKNVQRLIRQSDLDSSGYLSTYFDADWDDSELYDLVINTRAMTLNESVELITRAAGIDEIRKSPEVSGELYDLALNHKAKAALMEVTERVDWVDLEFENGVASLSGLVSSDAIKNECEKVILNIPGVESVDNMLNVPDNNNRIY